MTYSDALVDEMARIHAIAWECHDVSPTATVEPDVDDHDRAAIRAVLDHLVARGWTPPPCPRCHGTRHVVGRVEHGPTIGGSATTLHMAPCPDCGYALAGGRDE